MTTTNTLTTSYKTACGNDITVSDDTRKHLAAHPEAEALLQEAIGKVTLPEGGFLLTSLDKGRIIGKNGCLPASTRDDGKVTFAFRSGRDVPSRVLIGIEKQDTNLFTIIAGRQQDGTWLLYTSFAGPSAPREPHDPAIIDANANELKFWSENGLVYDQSVMGPTFESTWADVIGYVRVTRSKAAAEKAEADKVKAAEAQTAS